MTDPETNEGTGLPDDDGGTRAKEPTAQERIPLAQEEATVDVVRRHTGRVRVRTEGYSWTEQLEASLTSSQVEVERVPVGREVDEPQQVREEGDVLIVPVHEEVLVVRKQLVLKEELHLRRTEEVRTESVDVELRGQKAVIEREETGEE